MPRQANVSLPRALSKLGYCSRATGTKLVRAGRVRVNGSVRRNPAYRVDPRRDTITVNNTPIQAEPKVYLMLNKPRGLITTTADEKGRDTVYACLTDTDLPRIFPVGRLDKASEGLLLFTNDTQWANRITAPATHLDKVYHVQINRLADDSLVRHLRQGVQEGSDFLRAKAVQTLRTGKRNSWLTIVLDEGKNRHIRRMLKALDIEVLRLLRIAIGPLALRDLAKGHYRQLTKSEVQQLKTHF